MRPEMRFEKPKRRTTILFEGSSSFGGMYVARL
jgi:hypothetical protein